MQGLGSVQKGCGYACKFMEVHVECRKGVVMHANAWECMLSAEGVWFMHWRMHVGKGCGLHAIAWQCMLYAERVWLCGYAWGVHAVCGKGVVMHVTMQNKVITFLDELSDEALKKEATSEAKSDTFSVIMKVSS